MPAAEASASSDQVTGRNCRSASRPVRQSSGMSGVTARAVPIPMTATPPARTFSAVSRRVMPPVSISGSGLVFAEPCDPDSVERVGATTAISEYVRGIVDRTFPGVDPDALSTTVWALVHGLASLHLDGKLDTSTPEVVAGQVRAAVHALFTAPAALSPTTAAPHERAEA